MATKSDYYDRIISSLQSEITSLRDSMAVLKKEVEKNNTAPHENNAPTPLQQLEQDRADFLSQVAKVCHITIEKRYSGLSSKFIDTDTFRNHCAHAESRYLSSDVFKTFKEATETRLALIESKLHKRFSLLTVNRWKRDCDAKGKACSGLDTFLHTFSMNRYTRWLILFLITFSLTMALLFAVNENRHIRQENTNLYQTIELLKTFTK